MMNRSWSAILLLMVLIAPFDADASKQGATDNIGHWEKSAQPLWKDFEASRTALNAGATGSPTDQMELIMRISDYSVEPMMSQMQLDRLYQLMSRMHDPHDAGILKSEFNSETAGAIGAIGVAMSDIQLLAPFVENQDSVARVTAMQDDLSKMKDALVAYRESLGLK